MTELLPCPFCGGEASVFSYGGGGYDAKCRNPKCLAKIEGFDTEAEVIAAWNTRAAIEYDGFFYLPKPKERIVHYEAPIVEKTESGYKAKQPVEVIENAIRSWGNELGDYVMKRVCEIWNTRAYEQQLAQRDELIRDMCEKCGSRIRKAVER